MYMCMYVMWGRFIALQIFLKVITWILMLNPILSYDAVTVKCNLYFVSTCWMFWRIFYSQPWIWVKLSFKCCSVVFFFFPQCLESSRLTDELVSCKLCGTDACWQQFPIYFFLFHRGNIIILPQVNFSNLTEKGIF